MSFKQGIPLLDAFEEKEGDDDSDLDVEASVKTPEPLFKNKLAALLPCWPCRTRKHYVVTIVSAMASIAVLALLVALAVVTAHYIMPTTSSPVVSDTSVLKSKQDDREYSVVTLSNDLRVLLISDSETNISSAAMDVAVGSFSDGDHEGLAHFCEHMLFYGSAKYPKEGEYSDFLSQHGGYDNAYTSTQNTNYFFRVTSDYLAEALDHFAQFFISPILVQDGVSREVNAVDAEHRKNLQSDGWRLWQLLKHVSNPDHPFHNFSTGDLETLNTSDIVEALNMYYDAYYSANQVCLYYLCLFPSLSLCFSFYLSSIFFMHSYSILFYCSL